MSRNVYWRRLAASPVCVAKLLNWKIKKYKKAVYNRFHGRKKCYLLNYKAADCSHNTAESSSSFLLPTQTQQRFCRPTPEMTFKPIEMLLHWHLIAKYSWALTEASPCQLLSDSFIPTIKCEIPIRGWVGTHYLVEWNRITISSIHPNRSNWPSDWSEPCRLFPEMSGLGIRESSSKRTTRKETAFGFFMLNYDISARVITRKRVKTERSPLVCTNNALPYQVNSDVTQLLRPPPLFFFIFAAFLSLPWNYLCPSSPRGTVINLFTYFCHTDVNCFVLQAKFY